MNMELARFGLIDDEDIFLDVAALEIAAPDHPGVDLSEYEEQLAQLTEGVLLRSASVMDNVDRARVLSEVLALEHGFLGDRDTYDDPANADLIEVMDRRQGMPVTLSILYVAIARRAGWQAYALN